MNSTIRNNNQILAENAYQFVYTMIGNNKINLGSVYIKKSNGRFNSLIIVKPKATGADTLYRIQKTKFINSHGLDISIPDNTDFAGYKFVLRKNDYFTIIFVNKKGNEYGDNVNIEWDYKEKIFQVLKTP